MNFFKKMIVPLVILVGVVLLGIYYLYNHSSFMDGTKLDNQITQLIKQKDSNQVKKIAGDNATYNFLMDLPENTTPLKTSGSQGSNGKSEYFVTVLNGKKVDVLLTQSFKYGGLIKKVELTQITLQ